MKINPNIYPILQLIISGIASISYAVNSEWAKAVYWLSAAVLTAVVTFWLK